MTLFEPPPERPIPAHQAPDWRRPSGPPPPPGEQSPGWTVPPQLGWQPTPTPQWYAPAPMPRRTPEQNRATDRVAAIVLLALGLVGTIVAVATSVLLPEISRGAAGSSYFESSSSARSLTALAVVHVLLFLATVACTIGLWRAKRISFWVPLTAGAIAMIVYWSIVTAYQLADHSLRYVA